MHFIGVCKKYQVHHARNDYIVRFVVMDKSESVRKQSNFSRIFHLFSEKFKKSSNRFFYPPSKTTRIQNDFRRHMTCNVRSDY